MKKVVILFVLLLGPMAWMIQAQNTPPYTPNAGNPGPKPLIMSALDTNQDGVISALEIDRAVAALKTLDKNKDGKLTGDEYIPPRPGNPCSPADMNGPAGSQPPTARLQASQGDPSGFNGPPPASGSGERGTLGPASGHPPKPLIDIALDADRDGIISANEIANAKRILKKLDKNGDGQLTLNELMPPRPQKRSGSEEYGGTSNPPH